MKQVFDRYVETSFDGSAQATFKFTQFERNYRRYFPEDRSSRVLDIGIGRGEMLTCMKNWGYQEKVVDISPSTVAHCLKLGLDCELTDDTVAWLSARAGQFHLVTCLDVLEHVPSSQVVGFLAAVRDSLTVNGIVIVQVPNLQSPFGYLHHFNDLTHVTGFVEHSLSQALLAAGFGVFDFHGFEESCGNGYRPMVRKLLRSAYWRGIRALRRLNSNPDPRILNPVMYALVRR